MLQMLLCHFVNLVHGVRGRDIGTMIRTNDFGIISAELFVNSLSASLLLNIFLSFEVGIAHAIANFK